MSCAMSRKEDESQESEIGSTTYQLQQKLYCEIYTCKKYLFISTKNTVLEEKKTQKNSL